MKTDGRNPKTSEELKKNRACVAEIDEILADHKEAIDKMLSIACVNVAYNGGWFATSERAPPI